ncbi:MAG: 1-deoxy-D-xylulose-5-phosphate synthase, partial [Gemmataceae bacterium]|nr:1-deoxy-D-xylulose-5-phosphate synthase [Gemmataceae bacterium]
EQVGPDRTNIALKKGGSKAYTDAMSSAIADALKADSRTVVITAAMCQGNKLEKVRETFPAQFFDVGICESHAVAFAAGMAKVGAKPIVDIYSTFLQRSFDQIFQEVALQNLPVIFTLDRAGLTGPDGPTHHGTYDIPYMRLFPNIAVMAPGDEADVAPMLEFALAHKGPTSIRYPKANLERVERSHTPIEFGKAEVYEWGEDGAIIAFGAQFPACVKAAEMLREEGLNIGVINARFAKPLDKDVILRAVDLLPVVVTIEEGTLEGGFGSAVLEAANAAGIDARNVVRVGLPDRFVEHAERAEILADLGLDATGIAATVRKALQRTEQSAGEFRSVECHP